MEREPDVVHSGRELAPLFRGETSCMDRLSMYDPPPLHMSPSSQQHVVNEEDCWLASRGNDSRVAPPRPPASPFPSGQSFSRTSSSGLVGSRLVTPAGGQIKTL